MDIPRLKRMSDYWREFPPLHVLMKNYVGYKEPATLKKTEEAQHGEQDEFLKNVPKYVFIPPPVKIDGK